MKTQQSSSKKQPRPKVTVRHFRIPDELWPRIEHVQEAEIKRRLYPCPKTAIIVMLLKMGLEQWERGQKP